MKITVEKCVLLGADFFIGPEFTLVTWHELSFGEWVTRQRKITPEKSNLLILQSARIKEIQLTWLN